MNRKLLHVLGRNVSSLELLKGLQPDLEADTRQQRRPNLISVSYPTILNLNLHEACSASRILSFDIVHTENYHQTRLKSALHTDNLFLKAQF
jgi:hypothetical protein